MSLERRRRVVVGRAVLAVALLTVLATVGEVFEELELPTVDARFGLRGEQRAPDDVVVVAVDEATLARDDVSWPLPLDVHAHALGRLAEAGVAAVVVDVPFGPGGDAEGVDDWLAALAASPPTILATARTTADGEPVVLGGPASLQVPGVRAADSRLDPDDDGAVRRIDHTLEAGDDDEDEADEQAGEQQAAGVVPTIAVVVAAELTDTPLTPEDVGGEGAVIDVPGPAGTVATVSLGDVLDGVADPALLTGRIAVVGPTAASLDDRLPTALSERTSVTEIHAVAIGTVIDGLPVRRLPVPLSLLLVAGGCLAAAGVVRLRSGRGSLVVVAGAVAYLVAAQVAFLVAGLLLPVVPVVAGLLGAAAAVVAVDYLHESRSRQRADAVLGRYVPASVARRAVDAVEGGDLLDPVQHDVTVMFSDLRGFTTLSESRPPEQVMDLLNRYLAAMTDVILDQGGTVVSYMGDGIMAVFGAPDPLEAHADRALAAAGRMLALMDGFNGEVADALDGEVLRTGIGLNSGPVTGGNLGTDQRREYTVIGDTVNTASRIEGMTKASPYDLLVAASTVERLADAPDDLVAYDTLPVRGRSEPVTLWTLERTRSG